MDLKNPKQPEPQNNAGKLWKWRVMFWVLQHGLVSWYKVQFQGKQILTVNSSF